MQFADRREAGRRLAQQLEGYRDTDTLVLALPRGGVVVGYEVAKALGLSLDVLITRKVGAPGNPEYALGAVCETGDVQVNEAEVAFLGLSAIYLNEEVAAQRREIERRVRMYRDGAALVPLAGRRVILVDDGIATGYTVLASIRALKKQGPAHLALAVPVAPPSTLESLGKEVDAVFCLSTPEPFMAVGAWYRDFEQVSDEEVRQLLDDSRRERGEGGGPSVRLS